MRGLQKRYFDLEDSKLQYFKSDHTKDSERVLEVTSEWSCTREGRNFDLATPGRHALARHAP